MKRTAVIVGVLALSVFAGAREVDQKRRAAIWNAVEKRLESQKNVWFATGDFPACIQLLKFEVESDPGNYEHETDLGWLLESTERNDEALAVYVRFRKNFPQVADAAFPEANYYFMHRAFAKVPPLLEPTLKSKPHPNSFRILAHAYERMGLLGDARRVWRSLVQTHPEDTAAKANLQKVETKLKTSGA